MVPQKLQNAGGDTRIISQTTNKIFYFPKINCFYIRFDGYITTTRPGYQAGLTCGDWFGEKYGGSNNIGGYISFYDFTDKKVVTGQFKRFGGLNWQFDFASQTTDWNNHHIVIEAFVKPLFNS